MVQYLHITPTHLCTSVVLGLLTSLIIVLFVVWGNADKKGCMFNSSAISLSIFRSQLVEILNVQPWVWRAHCTFQLVFLKRHDCCVPTTVLFKKYNMLTECEETDTRAFSSAASPSSQSCPKLVVSCLASRCSSCIQFVNQQLV